MEFLFDGCSAAMPRVQRDLRLDVGFRLSLYKLLLYKTGSFFKPHRDSEKDDGMFGTVVVQLPSFYEGGKLIVRHNHRTEEVELSSATTLQNGFSMFYTAFYCDCEHEVLPITSGVRACLVYNMMMTSEIAKEICPSATRLGVEGREADLLDLLKNYWPNNQKMVYCLSHKYSQKSLSLENLKSTDRVVAQFFKKYADACSLEVMIGILKRKKYRYVKAKYKPRKVSHRRRSPNLMYFYNIENGYYNHHDDYDDDSDELATISDVDSNDPNVTFYDDYKIKYLKSIDNKRHLPSMDVDFESEVLPENGFRDIKSFYENDEVTGNEGVQCSKFYQCAAIMIYRQEDLIPILVSCDAKLSKIEEIFLNEFEKHKVNISNEIVKETCLKWSHAMMDRYVRHAQIFDENQMLKVSNLFENFLMFDNVELMQKFLKIQKFQLGNFSYVYRMCHKHGWATFSTDIITKFGKLKLNERFVSLQKFIDNEDNATPNDADKQGIIHSIMKAMVTKFNHELEHPPRKPWHKYMSRPVKQAQRQEKTKKFLISLRPLANNVNFLYLTEYAKKKPMDIIVPALIAVGQATENVSDHLWMDMANHFKSKMDTLLERPIVSTFTWQQNVRLSCNCKHCQFVADFLQRSFQQTLDFIGEKPTRDHVEKYCAGLII